MGERPRSEHGQASAELVAIVPLLLLVVLAVGQLAVAGWALASAGEAARAAARVAHVGGDARAAGRRALPAVLESARIETDADAVHVRVEAPALLPGLPGIRLSAGAALDPGAGSR